jgi:hypothetical protein
MVSSNNTLSRVRGAGGLYRYTAEDRKTNSAAQGLTFYDSPFASYWMRESAQMADSEIIESGDVASRWSRSVILW